MQPQKLVNKSKMNDFFFFLCEFTMSVQCKPNFSPRPCPGILAGRTEACCDSEWARLSGPTVTN